jgi:hypothetical protein
MTAPSPQGISALLRKAGHTRAISKLRGGVSGYSVHKLSEGKVEVTYSSITMGTSNAYRYERLAKYADTIDDAGYEVVTMLDLPRLIVTAKEG